MTENPIQDTVKKRPIPDVSIVIVSFNTKELTRKCINYVKNNTQDIEYEVIVVDNASEDGSAEMIRREFPWVKLIALSANKGFAGGNIPGMKVANGRYILLLNSDALIGEGAITDSISYMDKHHKIGILGCKLTNPDGSLQPSARMLPGPLNKFLTITGLAARFPHSRFFGRVDFSWWDHLSPKNVGWVVGAFFMIRRETMEEIGYLDDRYFLYFEEIDYCIRARRAGWEIIFYPFTQVIHLTGQSSARTGMQISETGMQILSIRIESEFKYYYKLYGSCHAYVAMGVEFLWNVVILSKNLFIRNNNSMYKRHKAIKTMMLIIKTFKVRNWKY